MTSSWNRRQKIESFCSNNTMQSTEGWPIQAHMMVTPSFPSIPVIWGFSVLLSQAINRTWIGGEGDNTSTGNLSDACCVFTVYEAEHPSAGSPVVLSPDRLHTSSCNSLCPRLGPCRKQMANLQRETEKGVMEWVFTRGLQVKGTKKGWWRPWGLASR